MKEYSKIAKELDIDVSKDEEATRKAGRMMVAGDTAEEELEGAIKGHKTVVLGCAESLAKELDGFISKNKLQKYSVIAADGAVSACLERKFVPDVNVTDLDGRLQDILTAHLMGCITVAHVHGDNIDRFSDVIPKLRKKLVVTTQVMPQKNIQNYYGFTDGDRAVAIARHFKAKSIKLIGFDFKGNVSKYSKQAFPFSHKPSERKLKKLRIANRLIKQFLK